MTNPLYVERLNRHLSGAKTHHASGDYVQAGEKVWGALSALVNTRSNRELKRAEDKKPLFSSMVNKLCGVDSTIKSEMRQLGFRDGDEVFDAINGLHRFFYGGSNLSDEQASSRIGFFIKLLDRLKSS